MESICAEKFYGDKVKAKKSYTSNVCQRYYHRDMPYRILGPTQYWKVFAKQADALAAAVKYSNKTDTLCTFVYQQASDGNRRFIVAHPEMYWWHYQNRSQNLRCSYEVIPKDSPCWLYLDLEYPIELNTLCDGSRMTKTLIDIIRAYLLDHYHLLCDRTDFLILDSTSSEKFSRHVICTLRNVAFRDNLHVGRLIKTICNDIILYLDSVIQFHKILSHFNKADIKEMLVETSKGKRLFIDDGVYTKNRHFRLYLSTKWGKQSYLTVSTDCVHMPVNICREQELGIFLDSLISYFPHKQDLILLDFTHECDVKIQCHSKKLKRSIENNIQPSPYPEIDNLIRSIVEPGKIRISTYFEESKILSYEIYGNRYCENIGRSHKSNNIYWIVDLEKKNMYHKCHDIDCMNFSSVPKSLPEEIIFKLDVEGDTFISHVNENIT